MTTVMDGHIVVDDQGVARIGETRMKVAQLVAEMRTNGLTADDAAANFPLTIADVHAALAYYHDHRADLDRQMREIEDYADRMRAAQPDHITRGELLRRLAERGGTEP